MKNEELIKSWERIRTMVEKEMAEHSKDYEHPLCPWSIGDASEFSGAFDYISSVLNFVRNENE